MICPAVCYGYCVPAPPAYCEYGGEKYEAGDSFDATDGCNSCTCMDDGTVACTSIPEVVEVRHRVFEMALEKGVQPRAEIMTIADAKQYLDMGVRHFSIGTDLAILHDWWKEQGEGLRRVLSDSIG